jgi:hypothetical protein
LGKNTNTSKKNTEALLEVRSEVDLQVNAEETKYVIVSRHQNAGQNHNLLTDSKFFEMWQSLNIWEQ